jgi:hypothetical protein
MQERTLSAARFSGDADKLPAFHLKVGISKHFYVLTPVRVGLTQRFSSQADQFVSSSGIAQQIDDEHAVYPAQGDSDAQNGDNGGHQKDHQLVQR